MKTQTRRFVPDLNALEGRQLLSTGTVSRPPATPWIEFQTPPPDMIAALSARVTSVETSVNQLASRVGTLETHSTGVDARLDALEARVAALEAKPDQSATIASLQATVASQAQQITSLQSQVADLQSKTQLLPTIQEYHVAFDQNLDYPVKIADADTSRILVKVTIRNPTNSDGKWDVIDNETAINNRVTNGTNFVVPANTSYKATLIGSQVVHTTDLPPSVYPIGQGPIWAYGTPGVTIDVQTWTIA